MLVCLLMPAFAVSADGYAATNAVKAVRVTRSAANPLITFGSSPSLGDNINGPSVIRVPAWIRQPLGKFYMYFGHHGGKCIRLAYADDLRGPWSIHEPGTLRLEQATAFRNHIASPDVHVDDGRRVIRMYFHGRATNEQATAMATSADGLHFESSDRLLGHPYFRVFRWKGVHYAIAKAANSGWGSLARSVDGVNWTERRDEFVRDMRHAAVMIRGNRLIVFYTRVGDAPERILVATATLTDDWTDWTMSAPMDVLRPEKEYEGIGYPNKPSEHGKATSVQQLRDPCVFPNDGRIYLFYSIAGEMGIAMAEVEIELKPDSEQAPSGDPGTRRSAIRPHRVHAQTAPQAAIGQWGRLADTANIRRL